MNIGNKILELRKKNNYTQEELASKLEISRQTLANWEGNITSPDLKQTIELTRIFKISLNDLMEEKVEISCRKRKNVLDNLINKECCFCFSEDFYDSKLNCNTKCLVLENSSNYIKVSFKYKKETIIKLIDLNYIVLIKQIVEKGDK